MIRTLVSLGIATAGVALIRFSQIDLSGPSATPRETRPDPRDVCERVDHAWITEGRIRWCARCEDWHPLAPWEAA